MEDPRFLKGDGRYIDDIAMPGMAYGYVLRSPHAHAQLIAVETADARTMPGVLAVFTGAELSEEGLGFIPCGQQIQSRDGTPHKTPDRPMLAQDRVRYLGEPVAFVVAETLAQARDAAERIIANYRHLTPVIEAETALKPGAPQLFDAIPDNLSFDWEKGDCAATDAALAAAARVVSLTLVNNRVVVNPIETRGAIGLIDDETGRLTLWVAGQGVHTLRRLLSERVFRIPPDQLRVVTPDVGGGFGTKNFLYPEYALVLWAARKLRRPVKWIAERSEGFVSDSHGRASVIRGHLALDAQHRFTALKVEVVADLGAYLSTNAPIIPTNASASVMGGLYAIPAIHFSVKGVFTNTVPVDAYRGAGRPESAYIIERLVEEAARESGIDAIALRRRNFISPSAMPYQTAMGMKIDSGEFGAVLDRALARADHAGFPTRKAEAESRGRIRGLGLACYCEATLGIPQEAAAIHFESDGGVSLAIGTQSNGQGHATTYAQILAERLGVPFEKIRLIQGDTDYVATGGGHGGSRSLQLGGSALVLAVDKVIAKGKTLAAHVLEAAVDDIEFHEGRFTIAGTDRALDISALADLARDPSRLPSGMTPGLDESAQYARENFTFPNGCHVAEIEVDPETGTIALIRYTVVDDFGRVINPLLAAGQVHGGIVQGIGQALLEHTVFDASGQLLSGSLMDYDLPRADDVPVLDVTFLEVPATSNPLGIKGCGEAGCVGALPAVMNGLIDALKPFGIRHLDMPVTPERMWRLVHSDLSSASP
jgi:carbon-monoxide dehydrogenase large subunit